jgi:hypothetical protein
LTGALEVLAQQGPTRESLDVFQLVLQSGTFLEPKQLHHVVQGLRRNAGEEAGALLRQAERRYGDERAIDDVTLQILLPNTDDGTPSVEERHLNSRFWRVANEGLDAMVRVAHVSPDHDLQILTLEALRRHPAPLSPPMLEKIITAWTRDPSFRGSSGRTVPAAAVDVLIANGSAEARKLLTKYLISDETAPSTRRAIVQRFGQEIPDVILDVAMSETVDLALRTTAVVELAEFTLHPDRYPPPSITAELGG